MKKIIISLMLLVLSGSFIACGSGGISLDSSASDNDIETIVSYSLDYNDCLVSDNSEAAVNYSNGDNKSKTLIWNCADYDHHSAMHIELFFTSSDGGQCYKYAEEYIVDGMCDTRAISPAVPTMNAKISDFQLNSAVDYKGYPGFVKTATFENSGNVILFDTTYSFIVNGDSSAFGGASGGCNNIPMNDFYTTRQTGAYGGSLPGQTIDVTITLMLWDNTILDSQTRQITIPD